MTHDFEKLGLFYLGRRSALESGGQSGAPYLYDSNDLVTHGVVVGMTGSGKTGLGVVLVEEAAIDRIPAIVIDPKGDLSNLLLTFPDLRPEDFAPWIDQDEARRREISPAELAAEQANVWKDGLAAWHQDGERIRRVRESAEFAVYTPGTRSGRPVSILRSFEAPDASIAEDEEAVRERVVNTATTLLGLLKIDADPVTSREHILLSTILDRAWRQRQNLDLASLVQRIQSPEVTKVGVLDLDSFFPPKDRFAFAMAINNLLAAPAFASWLEGDPLDVDALLHTATGKPRVAIFSIAHLSDAERMFFVSLLLGQVIEWMRKQRGTSSLRALLYMDEILGYFPPVANPPSKAPLLTLLKQARAFGLGVVLSTQNPVDLDYKGLSNAGTWFIGRLQTERDKARLLEGLESVAQSSGDGFDRARMDAAIGVLPKRTFIVRNVHDPAPVMFETRWALSYLRGPLSRQEIRTLTEATRAPGAALSPPDDAARRVRTTSASGEPRDSATGRPVLPPDVPEYFLPAKGPGGIMYAPHLLGTAHVRFRDQKTGIDESGDRAFLLPLLPDAVQTVDWLEAQESQIDVNELEKSPADDARFLPLPRQAFKPGSYSTWARSLAASLPRRESLTVFKSERLGLTSTVGESERSFRVRLQQVAREGQDEAKERLRKRYAPRIAALDERKRRAEQSVARESEQASSRKVQTAVSFGAAVLGSLLGRKALSTATLGRATTVARDVGRSMKETQDISRARETLQAIEDQRAELTSQLETDAASLEDAASVADESLKSLVVTPRKTDIAVQFVGLVWIPRDSP
jgi:hypothetical protein